MRETVVKNNDETGKTSAGVRDQVGKEHASTANSEVINESVNNATTDRVVLGWAEFKQAWQDLRDSRG
jgi:hypothetical protein